MNRKIIDYLLYDGTNANDIIDFCEGCAKIIDNEIYITCRIKNDNSIINFGIFENDYVVKYSDGLCYAYPKELFEMRDIVQYNGDLTKLPKWVQKAFDKGILRFNNNNLYIFVSDKVIDTPIQNGSYLMLALNNKIYFVDTILGSVLINEKRYEENCKKVISKFLPTYSQMFYT